MLLPEGFTYFPNFLSSKMQHGLIQQLELLEFTHDRFRGRRLTRGYAQFGYRYQSNSRKVSRVDPLPPFLEPLIWRIDPHCPDGTEFNQCLITFNPADAGIGWHTDAACFGDCIAGVSLGEQAKLEFRNARESPASCQTVLHPGSLYMMTGAARWQFQHRVEPLPGSRYSLTFRSVPELSPAEAAEEPYGS